MSPVEVDYLGEGLSDEAVARKLITAAGGRPGVSYRRPLAGTGKASLDSRLNGLNQGVKFGKPVLVLRDLDHDCECPAALVAHLLPNRHPRLLLRVCVRESEAWLFADALHYAHYCGVATGKIPVAPEALDDPKQTILGWIANGQAMKLKRHLDKARRSGVPDWRSLGEWHAEFAAEIWDPTRAASSGRSPSLARTLGRLAELLRREALAASR